MSRNGAAVRLPALLLCAGVPLIVCLAVLLATPRDAYWIADCGNKALTARRLVETGFRELNFDQPAAHLDPDGRAFPIPPPFAVPRGDGFVSFYPPAFAALAAPFLMVFGELGLRVPAALGVAAAALLFALFTAPALGERAAIAGGLVLALGTPLFFYGVTVWEHSLTAALSLASWLLARRAGAGGLLAAGLCLGMACWLREEMVLMIAAVGIAQIVTRPTHEARSLSPALWVGAGALPPLAALLLFNTIVFGHPLGVHVLGSLAGSEWASGWALSAGPTAVVTWLHTMAVQLGAIGSSPAEGALLAAGVAWVVLSVVVAARGDGLGSWSVISLLFVGMAIWLHGSLQIATAQWPMAQLPRYNGLLVQLPLFCLVGVGAVAAWRDPVLSPLRAGILAGVLFLAFEVMFRGTTRLFTGGQWGPRELVPALPAVVALGQIAIREILAGRVPARGPSSRGLLRLGAALVVAAGFLSSMLGGWLLAEQKREAKRLQTEILSAPPEVVVTSQPLLGQQLASMWGRKPMLLARDGASMEAIVSKLRESGVPAFLGVAPPGSARSNGGRCETLARKRGRSVHYMDADLSVCPLSPPAP